MNSVSRILGHGIVRQTIRTQRGFSTTIPTSRPAEDTTKRILTALSAVVATATCYSGLHDDSTGCQHQYLELAHAKVAETRCDNSSHPVTTSAEPMSPPTTSTTTSTTAQSSRLVQILSRPLGWFRTSYSFPRPLTSGDPDWIMDRRKIRQRQRDEQTVQRLQPQIAALVQELHTQQQSPNILANKRRQLASLLEQLYDLLYGKGTTPRDRQDFLEQYGCTGWTEEILETLTIAAKGRGMVEIGAGNGQWARALTYYYSQKQRPNNPHDKPLLDFVLAYDDQSQLPLAPSVYHAQTQAHRRYFFDKVQPMEGDDMHSVLRQWSCRGRILLLVYPPLGDMAVRAVKVYTDISPFNDTIVYVGEGKGGANANDDFFDYFVQHNDEWSLETVLNVKSFGSKGYEKLFILKKTPAESAK